MSRIAWRPSGGPGQGRGRAGVRQGRPKGQGSSVPRRVACRPAPRPERLRCSPPLRPSRPCSQLPRGLTSLDLCGLPKEEEEGAVEPADHSWWPDFAGGTAAALAQLTQLKDLSLRHFRCAAGRSGHAGSRAGASRGWAGVECCACSSPAPTRPALARAAARRDVALDGVLPASVEIINLEVGLTIRAGHTLAGPCCCTSCQPTRGAAAAAGLIACCLPASPLPAAAVPAAAAAAGAALVCARGGRRAAAGCRVLWLHAASAGAWAAAHSAPAGVQQWGRGPVRRVSRPAAARAVPAALPPRCRHLTPLPRPARSLYLAPVPPQPGLPSGTPYAVALPAAAHCHAPRPHRLLRPARPA